MPAARGLHTLAPQTPLVTPLRAQPEVTLSSEATAAARLSLLKDPALAAPKDRQSGALVPRATHLTTSLS